MSKRASTPEAPLAEAFPDVSGPDWPTLAALPDQTANSAASDAATLVSGVYAAQALIFTAGLMQKGLLGPVGAGYWALMGTIYSFFGLSAVGVFDGASRQIPAHRGRGDYRGAAEVADTAGTVALLASAAAGAVVAVVAVVSGGDWAPELRYGLVLLGLLAPLRVLVDFHELIFQSTKRFRVLSTGMILKAVAALVVQTACAYFFGFYGMFAGLVATMLVVAANWFRLGLSTFRRPAFRLRLRRRRLRELVVYGVPIMAFSQVWLLFVAVDSLIVARFAGVESLGFYALAVSVTNYMLFLPKSIAAAIFPRMQERYAPSEEIASIRHYVTDVQRILAFALVPPFVGAAFFLLPFLIRQALPDFEPAIPVVQLMVAASFFIALVQLPIEFLVTTGYRWRATALMVACLVVNAAANFVAVAVLDRGVKGAAVATAASYLVLLAVMTGYALSKALDMPAALRHGGALAAVTAWTLSVLWLVERTMGSGAEDFVGDALLSLAKLGVALFAIGPWLYLAQRRYGVVSIACDVLSSASRLFRRRGARTP